MIEAPLPTEETERLKRLERFRILDTSPEAGFDRITRTAAALTGTPISLVSLVDADRQWFKSRHGLDAEQTPRKIAFCSHAILQSDVFVIEDAAADPRFSDNPLVAGPPDIRFYASAPLTTDDGFRLGTLCVIDRQPRALSAKDGQLLRDLADTVMAEMKLRLMNDELDKANQAKDMFFAQISHELRTPLNAIIGFSEALQSGIAAGKPGRQNEYLRLISSSSRELSDLLSDMLDFARTGRNPDIHLTETSPRRIVDAMMPVLEQLAVSGKLSITNALSLMDHVKADEQILRRVLMNLCTNAIKYNRDGGAVRIDGQRIDNGWFRISVADNGIGIPPEMHSRVFQLYDRLGKTDSYRTPGSGVGLHLAKQMVTAIGGRIDFSSKPGEGSRFWVDLPMSGQAA